MFTDGTWHLMRWLWGSVFFAYLIVQVLAIRRRDGESNRQSQLVLTVMVVAVTVQSWIQEVFENRLASRISMLAVGLLAGIATVYLLSLPKIGKGAGQEGESRERVGLG